MSVRSAQSVTVEFTTRRFDTGAGSDADSLPTGTLVVNGTDNGATVTVTKIDTGRYKAAVTLPTLAVGDIVELSIAATVNSVSDKAIVWRDTKDMLLDSSGKTTDAVQTGDSYAIVNSGTYGNAQLVRSGTTPSWYSSPLDASGTRSAVGLSSANLDTQLGTIAGYIDTEVASILADAVTLLNRVTGSVALNADIQTLLSRITGVVLLADDYTAPLDAAGTRAAVGLGAADLDTQLNAIYTVAGLVQAKTDNLPADPAGLAALASAHGAGSWATATGFSTHSAADVWAVATRTLTAFGFSVTTNSLAAGTITTASIADGAITDAKITMPGETAGRPATALAILRRAWEWITNKRTRDRTTGTVTLYGADNTTTLETQTQSTASSVDSQSKGA